MALVEAFAHLTEVMIYRLNQLPEKAYVAFLNLLGVARHAPTAAWADVRVHPHAGTDRARRCGSRPARGSRRPAARIPAGRVRHHRAGAPAGREAPGDASAPHHCEPVEAELLGVGTGQPGQVLRAPAGAAGTHRRAAGPAARGGGAGRLGGAGRGGPRARRPHVRDLAAGGQLRRARPAGQGLPGGPLLRHGHLRPGAGPAAHPPATAQPGGTAPAVTVAAVPPAGRRGPALVPRRRRPGRQRRGRHADQPARPAARGTRGQPRAGRAAAGRWSRWSRCWLRGPYEFFAQQRAVTARDFEILATSSGAVARARAFTRAAVYSFARPGEVEVVLVPYVPPTARPGWPAAGGGAARARGAGGPRAASSGPGAAPVAGHQRRCRRGPGTRRCRCGPAWWCAARRTSDAVRRRIHDRLHQTLSPLPTAAQPDRLGVRRAAAGLQRVPAAGAGRAGRALRRVGPVRGRRGARRPRSAPWPPTSTSRAPGTPGAGRCCSAPPTAGRGWEPAGRFDDETVLPGGARPGRRSGPGIVPRPGSVAVVTRTGAGGSRVHLQHRPRRDVVHCSPTWTRASPTWPGSTGTAPARCCWPPTPACTRCRCCPAPCRCRSWSTRPTPTGASTRSARSSPSGARPAWRWPAQASFGVYLSTAGGRARQLRARRAVQRGQPGARRAVRRPGHAAVGGAGEPDPKKPGQGCHRTRLFESDVQVAVGAVRLDRRHLPGPRLRRAPRRGRHAERRGAAAGHPGRRSRSGNR